MRVYFSWLQIVAHWSSVQLHTPCQSHPRQECVLFESAARNAGILGSFRPCHRVKGLLVGACYNGSTFCLVTFYLDIFPTVYIDKSYRAHSTLSFLSICPVRILAIFADKSEKWDPFLGEHGILPEAPSKGDRVDGRARLWRLTERELGWDGWIYIFASRVKIESNKRNWSSNRVNLFRHQF